MSYFVYILRSDQSDRYYVGSSEDPDKRLLRHNAGATPSTKPFRPWRIVYIETHVSKAEALKQKL